MSRLRILIQRMIRRSEPGFEATSRGYNVRAWNMCGSSSKMAWTLCKLIQKNHFGHLDGGFFVVNMNCKNLDLKSYICPLTFPSFLHQSM